MRDADPGPEQAAEAAPAASAAPRPTDAAGPEHVAVGFVLGAFGPAGLVRVRPLTDFPERLLELGRVRLVHEGPVVFRSEWRAVTSVRRHGGGDFVFELEGLTNRDQAIALGGARLEIPGTEVKSLPPGHYYRFQVVGLEVRDEGNQVLGRVREILETGANDVFVVAPDGGGGLKSEMLIPALKDVVLKIDLGTGQMVVRPPRTWDG